MGKSDSLEMDILRISSQKVVDPLAHSHSSTNMSKSISGTSLASSQTTQRTKCSSGFSSMGGSIRGAGSSVPHTPGPLSSSLSEHEDAEAAVVAPPRATRGGGNTVLGGVTPTMQGVLRRRARFSGWRTETGYFEVRSTALIAFSATKSGGAANHHVSLASLAHRIMHPQQPQHTKQAGDWSWSIDIAGAEGVVELPALTRKGTYAFAVEFGSGKRKTLVLAAGSATERARWMLALDRARHRVLPSDFIPVSVIGEGHFGKVLLVRRNKPMRRKNSYSSEMFSSNVPSLAEEGSEHSRNGTPMGAMANNGFSRGAPSSSQLLAVKEVALHKNTSLPGVLNERQILGVLQEHPFVVTLQCAWRRGNFLYYGLDFLPGADLFELFRRQYIKMDMGSARIYGGQVALALEHLHAHGICYRDLKPENILVDAKGYLRLADMGLSKIVGIGKDLVRTSTVCGTRAYLAPEMVLRKPYGFSVDYWQYGCFLFELYAGHSPFWTPRSGPPGRANDQTVALILAGEISYSRSMEPTSKNLIRDLLHPAADSRLGCRPRIVSSTESSDGTEGPVPPESSEPGGWAAVRSHEFFKDMDWGALLRREIPAPLKPGPLGKALVGNFSREYTRQRAQWGGDQPELRDGSDREGLFKRELLGFDFVRHP